MAVETQRVGEASGVGRTPNFNFEQFAADREPLERLELEPIGESSLLNKAISVAEQQLSGAIPLDVEEELRQRVGETAVQGGVRGQIARNLVARDLGLTSLQIQQSGLQSAQNLVQVQTQREEVDRRIQLSVAQHNQAMKEWEDKFASALSAADQSGAQIALSALELQSRNRQFRIQQENALIIENSRNEIAGAQQNLDSMRNLFDNLNQQLQSFVNVFS